MPVDIYLRFVQRVADGDSDQKQSLRYVNSFKSYSIQMLILGVRVHHKIFGCCPSTECFEIRVVSREITYGSRYLCPKTIGDFDDQLSHIAEDFLLWAKAIRDKCAYWVEVENRTIFHP